MQRAGNGGPRLLWNAARKQRPSVIVKNSDIASMQDRQFPDYMNAEGFNAFFRRFVQENPIKRVPDIIELNGLISKSHHRSGQHPRRHFVRGFGGTSAFDDIFVEALMVSGALEELRPGEKDNLGLVESLVSFRTDATGFNPLRARTPQNVHRTEHAGPYCDAIQDFTGVIGLGPIMRARLQGSMFVERSTRILPRLGKKASRILQELAAISDVFSADLSPYAYSEGSEDTRLFAIIGPTMDSSWYCYGRDEDYLLTNLHTFRTEELRTIRIENGSVALISLYPWEPDMLLKAEHMRKKGISIAEPKGRIFLGDREFGVFDWVRGMTLHALPDIRAWVEFGGIIRRCHESGIIHMDIAGRNAVWEAYGSERVKLIDFEHIEIVKCPSRGFMEMARTIAFESLSRQESHHETIEGRSCIDAFKIGYDRIPASR